MNVLINKIWSYTGSPIPQGISSNRRYGEDETAGLSELDGASNSGDVPGTADSGGSPSVSNQFPLSFVPQHSLPSSVESVS